MNFRSGFNFFKQAKFFFNAPKTTPLPQRFPTLKQLKNNKYRPLTQPINLPLVKLPRQQQRPHDPKPGEAAREESTKFLDRGVALEYK